MHFTHLLASLMRAMAINILFLRKIRSRMMMSSTIARMITAEMKTSRTFSVCHIHAYILFHHITSETVNPLLQPPGLPIRIEIDCCWLSLFLSICHEVTTRHNNNSLKANQVCLICRYTFKSIWKPSSLSVMLAPGVLLKWTYSILQWKIPAQKNRKVEKQWAKSKASIHFLMHFHKEDSYR